MDRLKSSKKAQAAAVDLVIAFGIFIIIFSTLNSIFNDYQEELQATKDYETTYKLAHNAIATFCDRPGTPKFWTPDNVIAIGLVTSYRNLDIAKIAMLMNISIENQSRASELLGIPNTPFQFSAEYENGTILYINSGYYKGLAQFGGIASDKEVISLQERTVLGNDRILIKLKVES